MSRRAAPRRRLHIIAAIVLGFDRLKKGVTMAGHMHDKVCLITGGAGSIGAASAKLLYDEGARVMLVDLQEAALQKAAAGVGGDVAWCAADVTTSDQVKDAVAATVARFGKIDVLFSNAGNFGTVAPIAARTYSTRCLPCMSEALSSAPSMRCRG